jgi:hypothetical protein
MPVFYPTNITFAAETYLCYENPYRCIILTDSDEPEITIQDFTDEDLEDIDQ